ncbi:hypothetical protein HDK90DRAFT_556802 [Phyllosticta capitalensis]|uniref:Retrotransposon gag domain-containing protein n=1 Tax=Phyllosticta capitalensis TaxID=121624 RepID=A0ABR1YIW7_9PEZI
MPISRKKNPTMEPTPESNSSSDSAAVFTPGCSEASESLQAFAMVADILEELCDRMGCPQMRETLQPLRELIAVDLRESSRRAARLDLLTGEFERLKVADSQRQKRIASLERHLSHQWVMISDLESYNNQFYGTQVHPRFVPRECGFFDPDLDKHNTGDFAATRAGITYYRDIEPFIEAVQATPLTISFAEIQKSLHRCLIGSARVWYDSVLSTKERKRTTQGKDLTNWIALLRQKWGREQSSTWCLGRDEQFQDLFQLSLTRQNLRGKTSTMDFFVAAVRAARQIGMTTTYSQLCLAYTRVAPDLRGPLAIGAPLEQDTLNDFISRADDAMRFEGLFRSRRLFSRS